MTNHHPRHLPAGILLLAAISLPASAQPGTPATKPSQGQPAATTAPAEPKSVRPAPAPDAQIDSLQAMLIGSWKASGKDPASGEAADFWMHIAPVTIDGMDHTLYVEQARADDPVTPYHQAVFQLYRNRGKLRLRTLEFRAPQDDGGVYAQAWLVPDLFPAINAEDLIATLDLEFAPTAGGFKGRTPYPYPNADDGAVEMTSELEVAPGKLVSTDRGFGPDGTIVWGNAEGSAGGGSLTWQHADPGFTVQRDDDGLVIINLVQPHGGSPAVDGETLNIDYTLHLADGTLVGSSTKSGQLMPVPVPPAPGSMIAGFIRGIAGVSEGSVRRLIIPPAIGYGDAPNRGIPGGSTLYFLVVIDSVSKPEPAPEAPPGEQPDAPEGGDAPK